MPPRWVLFDLNGTLLDPAPIAEPLGLGADASHAALDEAIHLACVETMSGSYRPLPELLGAALRRRAELAGTLAGLDEAIERAARMPAFPDAADALGRLREHGLEVGVLTNSPTLTGRRGLEAAGLLDAMSLVVGTDEIGVFKPDPRVYRHGVARAGCRPEEVCLVAAHGWDCAGAARAGLRSAWVARRERVLNAALPRPDVSAGTLLEAADAVAALV